MDIQRLRNLTTGRLHTKMEHIYQDIEYITGEKGIMTHMLPNASRAMESYLKNEVADPRFWDGAYDTSHTRDFPLRPMNKDEQKEFWRQYMELPSGLSLIGKNKE